MTHLESDWVAARRTSPNSSSMLPGNAYACSWRSASGVRVRAAPVARAISLRYQLGAF